MATGICVATCQSFSYLLG